MAETFTLDELNSSVEPKSYSLDELNNHSFTLDDLNASAVQLPTFDAASAKGPVLTEQDRQVAMGEKLPPEWTAPFGGQINVPSGANSSVPGVTIPLSAVGQTAAGFANYFRSPQGITEALLTRTPAAPIVYAKWAKDMIQGGVQSVEHAGETLAAMIRDGINHGFIDANSLNVPKDSTETKTKEYIQDLANDAVNVAAMSLGAAGAIKGGIKSTAELPKRFISESTPAIEPEIVQPETTKPIEPRPESAIDIESKAETITADPEYQMALRAAQDILKAPEELKAPESAPEPSAPDLSALPEPTIETEKPSSGLIAGTDLEKWADDLLKGGGTHLGPDVLAAYIVKGAAVIERVGTDFAKWSSEALKDLGEEAKPYLSQIFRESQRLYESRLTRNSSTKFEINPPSPAISKLRSFRDKLVNSWSTRGNKDTIARLKDAADSEARIFGKQQGNSVAVDARSIFGNRAEEALRALDPVIESGGDFEKLQKFIDQSQGKHAQAAEAARFAQLNWQALQPLAQKVKAIHESQLADEHGAGIDTTVRENYIKHAFDVDKLPNHGEEFFGGSSGSGRKSGFKAQRKFETIYDAIEAGYGDAIKTLDASKLVESRVAAGQQLVNDRAWVNSFRSIVDPTTNRPLVSDITFDANHYPHAPAGYDPVQILPGQFVAVHKGYQGIFKAVTGESKIPEFEIAGLPAGKAALNVAAGIKHNLLLIDTFHASRMMQKQFFLTGKIGWNKGKTLLEYNDADLNTALKNGEITKSMADYARQNRPTAELLIKQGLGVGRITDALYSETMGIPGLRKLTNPFTKWVFDKVTRGAMMESAISEFKRLRESNPKLSDAEVAAKISKDINTYFGNLGRQGAFKSRTFQDIARLVLLAPQWVEAMARNEIRGFGQIAKVPIDLARGKALQVGTLGKAMAQGLFAYFVATQLINLRTRHKFTWQNPEQEHKLDAWIPDVTGKTPGYFISPMSVVAELTHDAYRFAFKKDNAIDVARQIAQNKLGPLARSVAILWSGKNFMGEKIDDAWNRIKDAAIALAPIPIPLQASLSNIPGQAQRQVFGSAGLKIEPASSALQQIQGKATDFAKKNGAKREIDIIYHEEAPHKLLRQALAIGDEKKIAKAITLLRGEMQDESIFRGQEQIRNRGFTGSNILENKFRQSLTPEEKQTYRDAQALKDLQWRRFLKAWQNRGPRPKKEK